MFLPLSFSYVLGIRLLLIQTDLENYMLYQLRVNKIGASCYQKNMDIASITLAFC